MIYFHMQRFKFIDFMVIQVRFFKKKKNKKMMKNMDKMWKSFYVYITSNFGIPVVFHTLSTLIALKVKST